MFVLKYHHFKVCMSRRWGKLVVYQYVALVTKGADLKGITMQLYRLSWDQKIHRGANWKVLTNQGICSKHFVVNDFITTSLDTNTCQKRRKTYVYDGIIRKAEICCRLQDYLKRKRERDTVRSLKDIQTIVTSVIYMT